MDKDTQFVLVEAISQFRSRYVIEVQAGTPPQDYLDRLTLNDITEFSSDWLGETVISHRVVDRREILNIHAEDHPLWIDKSEEQKFDVFVHSLEKN